VTTIGWDQAVSDAHEGIAEEMIRQVKRGEIYRSTREVWYRKLPDDRRTELYGLFPPVLDHVLDEILDRLLADGKIHVSMTGGMAGLLKAHVSK
jgi:hypothetical protein